MVLGQPNGVLPRGVVPGVGVWHAAGFATMQDDRSSGHSRLRRSSARSFLIVRLLASVFMPLATIALAFGFLAFVRIGCVQYAGGTQFEYTSRRGKKTARESLWNELRAAA